MKTRIGYFIPGFPGQTHIFFWRERQALDKLGIETDLVSTRRPQTIASHAWADEAQKNTTYLVPFGMEDFLAASVEILKAGPAAWLHCLAVILKATDTSLVQKLRLLGMILMAGKLGWVARTNGWSCVHVHSCADAANIAMFAKILTNLNYSLTLHGPTLDLYGPNQKQKWKYAAFALIISEKLLYVVKDRLADFLPKQIAVAPMGVEIDNIKRHSQYIPWQAGTPCRLFSCGRLNPVKGYKYLIETVELLRQRGLDVRLQIAGEDEQSGKGYRIQLEEIIGDKSLSEYVEMLGSVSEERVRKGIEDAHVFALASLNEGVPVAVMEAMAMEIPVCVTDVGGMCELVDNGVDGILVQPENSQQMADAIERVLWDRNLALSLSERSRKKIAEKFYHQRSAETLARCLEELQLSTPTISSDAFHRSR